MFRGVPNRNPPRKCTFRLLVFWGQKSCRLFPGRLRTQTAKALFCAIFGGETVVCLYILQSAPTPLCPPFPPILEAAIVSTGRVQFLFSGNTDRLFPRDDFLPWVKMNDLWRRRKRGNPVFKLSCIVVSPLGQLLLLRYTLSLFLSPMSPLG